jgi:hypothetical protein
MGKRTVSFALRSIIQNGSAAFHGGELEVARTNISLLALQQAPPWKAALPGAELNAGA